MQATWNDKTGGHGAKQILMDANSTTIQATSLDDSQNTTTIGMGNSTISDDGLEEGVVGMNDTYPLIEGSENTTYLNITNNDSGSDSNETEISVEGLDEGQQEGGDNSDSDSDSNEVDISIAGEEGDDEQEEDGQEEGIDAEEGNEEVADENQEGEAEEEEDDDPSTCEVTSGEELADAIANEVCPTIILTGQSFLYTSATDCFRFRTRHPVID